MYLAKIARRFHIKFSIVLVDEKGTNRGGDKDFMKFPPLDAAGMIKK